MKITLRLLVCVTFGLPGVFFFTPLLSQTAPPESVQQQAIREKHKTLYPEYHSKVNILREIQAGKDVDVGVDVISDYATSPDEMSEPAYPDLELRRIACDADATVVASPKSSETNITASGDFLYTDYVMHVESVAKGSDLSGSDIIVTKPGGETTINGHSVHTDAGFPLFQPHARYLLFLRYLPDTKTYRAFKNGTFLLDGKVVSLFGSAPLNIPSAQHEDTFLTEVRAAVTAPCAGITRTLGGHSR
jgi:hypothetical protein